MSFESLLVNDHLYTYPPMHIEEVNPVRLQLFQRVSDGHMETALVVPRKIDRLPETEVVLAIQRREPVEIRLGM